MTRNPVMNLWTAIVAAFLTLCTSLGLITTTAVAAVTQTGAPRNTDVPQDATAQEEPIRGRSLSCSLPPTMKQRIHAEAHGSSPSCRNRLLTDASADTTAPHENAPVPGVRDADGKETGRGDAAERHIVSHTAAAPADPSGSTRSATGVMGTGGGAGRPPSELGDGDTVLSRPAAPEYPPSAPASAPASVPASAPAPAPAPVTGAVPLTGVALPAQSSAPARLSAPAPEAAAAPDPSPVVPRALAAAGPAALR